VVGAEPFVLRTAMSRVLSLDPRLDVVVVPASGDAVALAADADVLVVSSPVELSGVIVARLAASSSGIELKRNGETQLLPYRGLEELSELFASVASLFPNIDLTDETRAPPRRDRSDPENGGPPRGP